MCRSRADPFHRLEHSLDRLKGQDPATAAVQVPRVGCSAVSDIKLKLYVNNAQSHQRSLASRSTRGWCDRDNHTLEITDRIDGENPFVGCAWPRADFDGAAHEFLIGLLATAAAPTDDEERLAWWEVPPAPEMLQERFAEYADAFFLDGDGARFMQDADDLEGAVEVEVGALLIDAPGENTLKKNADLFVKRGSVSVLCRAAAAMALFTLQAYAPSGGEGHRTSLRGGGSLTTSAVAGRAGQPPNLWGRLWPNVETRAAIESRGVAGPQPSRERIFPWLAPTRT
jgi:CRISPR system Cascade subunit CasA